jgi:tetratricopeptide (TPR) repeat protein
MIFNNTVLIRSQLMSLISRFDFHASLLAGTATVAALVISQPALVAAKSPQEIAQIAITRTVQINPKKGGGGSGVIVSRQGNTYTVLTCIHVLESKKHSGFNLPGLTVRTHDGKIYPLTNIQKLGSIEKSDLAIVTFSSSANYPVAKLANSEHAVIGSQIFIFGYPALDGKLNATRDFEFVPGFVTSRPSKGSPKGFEPYTMRYNAVTVGGMSGGPVFDVDGRVVGIHGQGGREESAVGIQLKTGFNAAVPINTYEALRSQIAQSAPKIEVDNNPSTDKPTERLSNPKSPSDFVAKGVVERAQGDESQAIDAYTQAINLDPNHADAYYQRGNTRYDQGNKEGALEDYTQAINLDPEYANAYYQRGVIRYEQSDKQGALADFEQYISRSPNDIQAHYNRGVIRRDLRDYQGTFADFDQVVRLGPDDARAYYNRGVARSLLRDRQGTLADFDQALRLDPRWTTVYNNRAIVRRRMGDREGAIKDFSEVVRLEPNNAIAYFNRGLVRRDLADRQGAIKDLQIAADLFQQQGDTNNYQKTLEKIQSIQATPGAPRAQQPEPARESSQPTLDDTATPQPEPAGESDW